MHALTIAVGNLHDAERVQSETIREIGAELGARGLSLADATASFNELVALFPRRQRDHLSSWEHAITLAEGWFTGTTMLEHRTAGGIDGTELLCYRLHQHYDRCAVLGLSATEQFALVVIDLGLSASVIPADLIDAHQQLNASVLRTFHAGETVAMYDQGRALILCERHDELPSAVHVIIDSLRNELLTRGASPHGWIEPLPPDRVHASGLIAELTAGSGNAQRTSNPASS